MKETIVDHKELLRFLIARINHYISLNDTDIQIIKSLFKFEAHKANSVLLQEGSYCNKLWFIAKGIVRFSINMDGDDRTFIFRKEGHFTSDIEGLLKKTPAAKSIITIEDCYLFSISYDNLQELFKHLAHGERFGRLLVEETFIGAVSHIVSFYTEPPEERYKKFVQQNPDLVQRIPQYHIASFLGIKPQSLCRIKKRLINNL